MKKRNFFLLLIFVLVMAPMVGCFIYHEPEFKGKILDIDTNQPIEGAVVVVEYKKATMGVGAGSMSSIINVRETLTVKDGSFYIPSYATMIAPFSWQIPSMIIIFKPGYASLEIGTGYFAGLETREQEGSWPWAKDLKFKLTGPGIVELPKLRTREERWHASFVGVTGYSEKELPLLYKARSEEDKSLGIK